MASPWGGSGAGTPAGGCGGGVNTLITDTLFLESSC